MNRDFMYQNNTNLATGTGSQAPIGVYPSREALVVERFQHEAVVDHCTALLTKTCMDNAAALVSYATHLCDVAPEGREIYGALMKGYAVAAAKRIMKRGEM